MTTAKALGVGAVAAAATLVVAVLVPKPLALGLLASLLWGVAFVYLGFVLLDGRRRGMLIEFGNIGLTISLATLGVWVAPAWLAAGYFLHGLWDAVHHSRGVQTKMPRWYIPFCLLHDWLVAGFILIRWRSPSPLSPGSVETTTRQSNVTEVHHDNRSIVAPALGMSRAGR